LLTDKFINNYILAKYNYFFLDFINLIIVSEEIINPRHAEKNTTIKSVSIFLFFY